MEATKYGETFSRLGAETQSLDTVRALHQTVVALRIALDKSRAELQALRVKIQSDELYSSTIEKLSLENHILRQRIIDEGDVSSCVDNILGLQRKDTHREVESTQEPMASSAQQTLKDSSKSSKKEGDVPIPVVMKEDLTNKEDAGQQEPKNTAPSVNVNPLSKTGEDNTKNVDPTQGEADNSEDKGKPKLSKAQTPGMSSVEEAAEKAKSDTNVTEKIQVPDHKESDFKTEADQSACSKGSQNDVESPPGKNNGESDNESEELDDIELIFTTEETKELGVLREDLVSITDADNWQSAVAPMSLKFADADQFEEVSEGEREVVVQEKAKEKSTVTLKQTNLTKTWTQSVLVETDISKCGVVDEIEMMGRVSRRNTLPNPLIYQPVTNREYLSGSKGHLVSTTIGPCGAISVKFSSGSRNSQGGTRDCKQQPVRPILMERNAVKRESEAQTDITALPSHWKSESYLAHKVSHNFPTLPSKFALPVQQISTHRKYSLRLSDKTQEARRTLLSDINFTSMVPELSRSADHLCQAEIEAAVTGALGSGLCRNYPHAHSYMKNINGGHSAHTGSSLISPGFGNSHDYGKEPWSPSCDYSQSGLVHYGSSQNRFGWDGSYTNSRYRGSLSSVLAQRSFEYPESKRRHSWRPSFGIYRASSLSQKPTWGSMPSSPTHCRWAPQSDVDIYCASYWNQRDPQLRTLTKFDKTYPIKTRTRSKVTFLGEPSFQSFYYSCTYIFVNLIISSISNHKFYLLLPAEIKTCKKNLCNQYANYS